jgi:hypothetical protein
MYFINSYFTVAIYLAVATSLFLAIFHWRHLLASESRLRRMMESCGVDRNTAEHADQLLKVDMHAVRDRCRHCPATGLCDHWLNEDAATSNSFCPNASVFRTAAGLLPRQI